MHKNIKNLLEIKDKVKHKLGPNNTPYIIAVSKTFKIDDIMPLIDMDILILVKTVQEAVNKMVRCKKYL